MTSTHWLLFGLIVLCVMCLFAVFIGHCIDTEWNDADAPIYRTADASVLSADTRAALHNANRCTGHCNQGRRCTCGPQKTDVKTHVSAPRAECCCDLETARREGTAAGLYDTRQKPGTAPTANPYAGNALAHVAWRRAYQHTSVGTTQPGTAC